MSPETNGPGKIENEQQLRAKAEAYTRANPAIKDFAYTIIKDAEAVRFDPALLAGLLEHESADFNKEYIYRRRGTDGHGRGIAQIDDRVWKNITDKEAFDPNFAIPWAAHYLADLQKRYNSAFDALRAYNGGPNFNSPNPGFEGVPIRVLTERYANTVEQKAEKYRR